MEAVEGHIWLPLTVLVSIALLVHLIMTRLKLPAVVGELGVGVLLGALALPLFDGFELTLSTFAQLGAIILLFLVGLESDLKQTYTVRSFWIAVGGVLLPWLGGFVLAFFFIDQPFPIAFAIGTLLVATSIAIPARILMDYGKIDTPTARVIMGAAVVDDIIAMTLLSIVISIGSGDFSTFSLVKTVIVALVFVAIGTLIGATFISKGIAYLDSSAKKRGLKHVGFMLAFAVAFLYAGAAELEFIGLSAIIGAFVAGASLSGMVSAKDLRVGGEYLGAIFIPIFFISLGMMAKFDSLEAFKTAAIIGLGLAMIVFITKAIGAGLVAKLFGMDNTNSMLVGFSMAPVGEVALIIALYGSTHFVEVDGVMLKLIPDEFYSGAVLMVIILSLGVPFLIKPLLEKGRLASKSVTKLYQGCDACLGPMWTGEPKIVCSCGASFHRKCALKLERCPECGSSESLPEL